MKETSFSLSIDPKSGFCSTTKIYHSHRPPVTLPPETLPLSAAAHALSLLHNTNLSPKNTTAFIEAATGNRLSYSQFTRQVKALSASLLTKIRLSRGDTAFILAPTSFQIPILYFSLLSIGAVISPANPASTHTEISHQIEISKPVIAFATSATAAKLPSFLHGTVLLDSPDFQSMMTSTSGAEFNLDRVKVNQADSAAILYSSGTTGRVKGVVLTHRNLIALIGGYDAARFEIGEENQPPAVSLNILPLFHVFGLFMCVRAVAMGETVVQMDRFDFEGMLKAIEAYRVTFMPVSPPLVVAMAKSEVVEKYDLSSLQLVGSGGAPLGKEVAERFATRFPNVVIAQVSNSFNRFR